MTNIVELFRMEVDSAMNESRSRYNGYQAIYMIYFFYFDVVPMIAPVFKFITNFINTVEPVDCAPQKL